MDYVKTHFHNRARFRVKLGRPKGSKSPARPGRPHGNSGERSVNHKLTECQALEIIRRYLAGEYQKDLAAEYGMSYSAVNNLLTRKTWKHLRWPKRGERGERGGKEAA